MICSNCGKQSEGAGFCPFCGVQMQQPMEVQQPAEVQPSMQQPAVQFNEQTTFQAEKPKRSKGKVFAIIGIALGVLVVAAAVLFFVLTSAVEGIWYNEERGEVLTLNSDGTVQADSMGYSGDGGFKYDRLAGSGSLDIGGQEYNFTANSKEIDISGLGVYTKAGSDFAAEDFLEEFGSLGTWYSEERGEAFAFDKAGKAQYVRLARNGDASYDYDSGDNSGNLTLGEASYKFSTSDTEMNIEGLGVYTKAGSDFIINDFIAEHGSLGTWYNEDRGEVLIFSPGGSMQSRHLAGNNDAVYACGTENGGTMTFDAFTYDFTLADGKLDITNMGVFTEAGTGFDAEAFMGEHGDSILGRWYDTSGEYTIDLRSDGTYSLNSYGRDMEGTYVKNLDGAMITFDYIDMDIALKFFLNDGVLNKSEEEAGAAVQLVRAYKSLKGADNLLDDVAGTWLSEDGSVTMEMGRDGSMLLKLNQDFTGTYQYEPMGDVGFLNVVGGNDRVMFVASSDILVLGEVIFIRKQ